MADPFSIIKEIVEFGFKIKSLREKVKHNAEDCRWIDDFLGKVRAIAKHLQGSPNMEDDLMRDMVEGLRQALERASKFVANYEGTWFVSRAFNAGGISEKLRGVCLNVQLNMSAVQLANDALNNSVLVDVKENVDQLRADVTHNNLVMAELKKNVDQLHADVIALLANDALNNSVLVDVKENGDQLRENVDQLRADVTHNNLVMAELKKNVDQLCADVTSNNSMLKIVTAQRDVHLQEEMAKLVKDYQISSEIIHKKETKKTGVASSQTKNERATKKTGVASSQNKNKTGAKKTDVARQEDKIQKNNKLRGSTVVPHASLPDGLAESASAASVVGQYDGSSTIINKASSSILVDEAQSVGVSAAPFHPQKIISISEEPGATGRYKIISRSIENMTSVTSIDAHPTKTWILTGHEGGKFSIWDYQKQETVEFKVNKVPGKGKLKFHAWRQYVKETPLKHPVFSAKFIDEGKQLVVGDGHGYIYVYDCTDIELRKDKEFKAHAKSVNSLAAHPTKPYLLSSSAFSKNIKVWDWSKKWEQIQNFYVKPEIEYYAGVRSVKFNPRDTDTFACVTFENRVKVWNMKTSSLETTLKGPCVKADYFFTRSHQHLMVTLRSNSHNSEIWDLKTGKVAHTLSVSGRKTTRVACHPKLPILVTTLDDGTVCLWDASTYRLEKMVHITDSECRDLVFLPDTNGLPRLAVAFEKMIAIMEVNLPIANTSNASG